MAVSSFIREHEGEPLEPEDEIQPNPVGCWVHLRVRTVRRGNKVSRGEAKFEMSAEAAGQGGVELVAEHLTLVVRPEDVVDQIGLERPRQLGLDIEMEILETVRTSVVKEKVRPAIEEVQCSEWGCELLPPCIGSEDFETRAQGAQSLMAEADIDQAVGRPVVNAFASILALMGVAGLVGQAPRAFDGNPSGNSKTKSLT